MASRFRVRWTEAASTDLENIVRYTAEGSPLNATKMYRQLRKRTAALRSMPDRGHIVKELADLTVTAYRELVVSPYRIVYRVDKRNVFVHAILDGRRDVREILAERLLRDN